MIAELYGRELKEEESLSRSDAAHQKQLRSEFDELDAEEEQELNDAPKDHKSTLHCKDPFGFGRIPKTSKSKDFADVVAKKKLTRAADEKKNKKMESLANKFAGRTYDLMVEACADLLYGRRGTRMGFNKWLEVVGMESTIPKKTYAPKKKAGTLIVQLLKGSDIKYAVGTFGKKTCVVSAKVGSQEYISVPSETVGKNPVWNDEFSFTVTTETVIVFDVRDENDLSDKPKSLGQCEQVNEHIKHIVENDFKLSFIFPSFHRY